MPSRTRRCLRLLGLLCAFSRAAWATTAQDLCPGAPDPCVVSGTVNITHGSILNFGSRRFEIDGTLKIDAAPGNLGGGDVTITAGSFMMQSGAQILSKTTSNLGGTVTVTTTGLIEIRTDAAIDVSGGDGGSIDLDAGGSLTVNGPLTADGGLIDSDAGSITLAAITSLSLGTRGDLSATGGKFGAGGTIALSTTIGSISTSGDLVATGGSGFPSPFITIDAGGDLTSTGIIDVNGNKDPVEGYGGDLDVMSYGNMRLGGAINGRASTSGQGATITLISSTGSVTLAAPLSATGGSPDGAGGSLAVTAPGGFVQETGSAAIDLSSTGAQSSGGTLGINAAGGATLRSITVSASNVAGSIAVTANGPIAVLGLIDADGAPSANVPHTVDITSMTGLQVSGRIHADGLPGQAGGVIALQGCTVNLVAGAQLTALGTNGATELRSATQLVVAGSITAGSANRFYYRDASILPIITGSVTPAPSLAHQPGLPACGVTTSSTTTMISTTTTTATTTSSTSTTSATTSSTTTTATTQTNSTSTTTTTHATSSTTSTSTTPVTATTSTTSPSTTSTTTLPARCSPSNLSVCDDTDPCTDDQCTDGVCVHPPLVQYRAVDCRFVTLRQELTNAAGLGIPNRKLAQRLTARTDKARALLQRAEGSIGKPHRRRLKAVKRLTTRLLRAVTHQGQLGRIIPTVATRSAALATEALDHLAPLTTAP